MKVPIIDMWSYIVNTMDPKVCEYSIGLLSWEKIVQGFEVSATVCLQQSSTTWYVKLFVLIYACLMRIGINDNVVSVINTCTHAQAYKWDIARWKPELWYNAEVLGHIWDELIDCNAKMLDC